MNLNATILGQTIAFILFVLFCMKYIWPPLISAVDKRQKDIIDSFSSIELAKKDLEIAQAQAANDVIQAKAKAKKIIEQANQRKNEIINESKIEA
ncbi:ATP synthase F0 subunit B, partial [Candidatus Palibaumannia cicadellinicola]